MTKLISMTDFVLEVEKYENESHNVEHAFELIKNYANFLKQPLTLGMFVPCDENDNVLEEPSLLPSSDLDKYRKAKEKVIFEGWQLFRYNRGLTPIYNKELGYINFYGNGRVGINFFDPKIIISAVKTIEHLTHLNLQEGINCIFL